MKVEASYNSNSPSEYSLFKQQILYLGIYKILYKKCPAKMCYVNYYSKKRRKKIVMLTLKGALCKLFNDFTR